MATDDARDEDSGAAPAPAPAPTCIRGGVRGGVCGAPAGLRRHPPLTPARGGASSRQKVHLPRGGARLVSTNLLGHGRLRDGTAIPLGGQLSPSSSEDSCSHRPKTLKRVSSHSALVCNVRPAQLGERAQGARDARGARACAWLTDCRCCCSASSCTPMSSPPCARGGVSRASAPRPPSTRPTMQAAATAVTCPSSRSEESRGALGWRGGEAAGRRHLERGGLAERAEGEAPLLRALDRQQMSHHLRRPAGRVQRHTSTEADSSPSSRRHIHPGRSAVPAGTAGR